MNISNNVLYLVQYLIGLHYFENLRKPPVNNVTLTTNIYGILYPVLLFGFLLLKSIKQSLKFKIYLSQEFMKNDTQRGCYHRKTGFNTWKIRDIYGN